MRMRGKDRNDFKSGTSVGRLPSDSRASTAVKGLKEEPFAALGFQERGF